MPGQATIQRDSARVNRAREAGQFNMDEIRLVLEGRSSSMPVDLYM